MSKFNAKCMKEQNRALITEAKVTSFVYSGRKKQWRGLARLIAEPHGAMVDASTSKASLRDSRPERRGKRRDGEWQIESIFERLPSVWIRSNMG